jgi:hypothetical protein
MEGILSPAELAELKARPIGVPEWRNLTEEQIALRVEIGKKIQADFIATSPTLEPRLRDIYERYPMWGFYESAESEDAWPPRRAYGVCFGEDDDERLYTVTLMSMINNRTIGGCPVESLVRVDRWSPQTIQRMKSPLYNGTGIWEDPLGFVKLLMELHSQEDD